MTKRNVVCPHLTQCPFSLSLLFHYPSCALEKRGALSSNGMQLAIGEDLPSSCIDTMLSIATQVIISSSHFYSAILTL